MLNICKMLKNKSGMRQILDGTKIHEFHARSLRTGNCDIYKAYTCINFSSTDTGELYSWGHGGYGQLGHGAENKSIPTRTSLGDRKVIQVACGSYHSIALTSNGEVCGCLLNTAKLYIYTYISDQITGITKLFFLILCSFTQLINCLGAINEESSAKYVYFCICMSIAAKCLQTLIKSIFSQPN